MPFVQRDKSGVVMGLYANRQPGYAEEELASDDPEVLAYLTPKVPAKSDKQLKIEAALADASVPQSVKDVFTLL